MVIVKAMVTGGVGVVRGVLSEGEREDKINVKMRLGLVMLVGLMSIRDW
jgi:hypothetical protein